MALLDIKFFPFRDDRRSGRTYSISRKGSYLLKLILMMSPIREHGNTAASGYPHGTFYASHPSISEGKAGPPGEGVSLQLQEAFLLSSCP